MNKYAIIGFWAPSFRFHIPVLIKILNSTFKKPVFIYQDYVFIEKFLVIPDALLEDVEFKDNYKWRWKGYPYKFRNKIRINKNTIFECEDDDSALLWYELHK